MLKPVPLYNAIFLILLGMFAALAAIGSKSGFVECGTTVFIFMWPEGRFTDVPSMLWPIMSIAFFAFARLGFKHPSGWPARIAPFIPTMVILLFVTLNVSGVVRLGSRFVECVVTG